MEKKAYYFEFDATVWLSSMSKIQLCTHQEKGIFIDLCALCLLQNGFFDNDEFLAERLKLNKAELSHSLDRLLKLKLLVSSGSKMSVKFISEKLNSMKSYSEKMSENGKKGGRPKAGKSRPKPPYQEREKELERELEEEIPPTPAAGAKCGGVAAGDLWITGQESPEFRAAFGKWIKHLEQKSHRPVTDIQRAEHLTKCHAMGIERAIQAISFSILQGWRTINEAQRKDGQSGSFEMREY